MPRDVAQQAAHGEQGADEGHDEADTEHGQIGRAEPVPMLVEIVQGRGEHGGDGEEEGEFGGCLARQAEHEAADNGGARARDAGDQRQRLRQPDVQRIACAQIIDLLDTVGMPAPLDPQHEQAACDQRQRH